jgi:DNA-binding protein H-NS
MALSYKQLQAQIEDLQRQADKMRTKEVDGVVARIREAIRHYGLTAEQLGLRSSPNTAKIAKAKTSGRASTAKYADEKGNVWGGRGPRPLWLREAINAGRSLEQFASDGSAGSAKAPKPSKGTKRGKTKKRSTGKSYRDEAGNSWSGFGPRPRWLKEALEAGRTLEQLAV